MTISRFVGCIVVLLAASGCTFAARSAPASCSSDDCLAAEIPEPCASFCSETICGNGVVQSGEACDDGNVLPDDGCSAACAVEAGFTCGQEPSVCIVGCEGDGDDDGYGSGASCLGPDCNDAEKAVHPGAAEQCNGVDDDCDGMTDEEIEQVCFDGAASGAGVGRCRSGRQYCSGGVWGPCIGQVLAAPEVCDGQDDDCDGVADNNIPALHCGLGACASKIAACTDGVPGTCPVPAGGQTDSCTTAGDDDCDGLVDEGCDCVYVDSVGGSDDTMHSGLSTSAAKKTIGAGINAAFENGRSRVCVAATSNSPTPYRENVVMRDGISVHGGYSRSTWLTDPMSVTLIAPTSGTAVLFDDSVVSRTELAGFQIDGTGDAQEAVLINGAIRAVLVNNEIHGPAVGAVTAGVRIVGPLSGDRPAPLLINNRIDGGGGTDATGISSTNAQPTVIGPCDTSANGVCTATCGEGAAQIRGSSGSVVRASTSIGLALISSPGAYVDQATICSGEGNRAVGIEISGDATDTIVRQSSIGAGGGSTETIGVSLGGCSQSVARITENDRIEAAPAAATSGFAYGIAAVTDCHPVVARNGVIATAGGPTSGRHAGVLCSSGGGDGPSLCTVAYNREILGAGTGADTAAGVFCAEGGCARIVGNRLVAGGDKKISIGLVAQDGTAPLVDANHFAGGCGAETTAGATLVSSSAVLTNNLIDGGDCSGATPSTLYYGVAIVHADNGREATLHSNTVLAQIDDMSAACSSAGVTLLDSTGTPPVGPTGVFRNNIFHAGACPTSYAFMEADAALDPRYLQHNALYGSRTDTVLYFDENSRSLDSLAQIEAMTDILQVGNIGGDPQITGSPPQLSGDSPCIDAGTSRGAPTGHDFYGTLRPQHDRFDIGAYERP